MYFFEINYAVIIEAKRADFCSPVVVRMLTGEGLWAPCECWFPISLVPGATQDTEMGLEQRRLLPVAEVYFHLWPEFFRCLQAHFHSHQWPAPSAKGDSLISLIAKVNSEPILLSQTLALHYDLPSIPQKENPAFPHHTPRFDWVLSVLCPGFISTFTLNVWFLCFWNMTIIVYLNIRCLLSWDIAQ